MDDIRDNSAVNEKLRSFTDMALREAHRRKKELIDETEKEIEQKKKDMEIHLLEEAYRSMQTGTRLSRKELNEAISQALVGGKRRLFNKRKEIIDDVFLQQDKRLKDFKKADGYKDSMKKELKNAIELLTGNKFTIMSDKEDLEMFKSITSAKSGAFTLLKSNKPLEGGFIIYDESMEKRVDCSFITRLNQARDQFLEICSIPIDDGDLLDE